MARRGTTGFIAKYWGYLIFVLAIWGWVAVDDKIKIAPVLIVLSLGALAYFLFKVPHQCGAINRQAKPGQDPRCRNNAKGLMFGCHLMQHKRQNFFQRMGIGKWREANRGLWINPKECLASVVALTSIVSGIGGLVVAIVKPG
ncbi:hypothetical protein AB0O34_30305 [Sphaerisporangium sp. NPDC088356]|uniref:hypothetical protein n=1 Tax=Sphaerisporangium sp. NPDC088356 TaxID=3154871 RepID=UPI00343FDEB3